MARDPLLGEQIIWQGRPLVVQTPPIFKVAAAVWFLLCATSVCFAFTTALALSISPAPQLLFAAWTAALGVACLHGPKLWLSKMQYVLTEGHVIWRRGPFRRVISRRGISYARIFWHPDDPHVGDIELVRAVPTGVLRRRLLLRLHGLAAPDRVLALLRDRSSHSESNAGNRSMSQRLEDGERVLWSARPRANWRRYIPQGKSRWQTVIIAVMLLVGFGHLAFRLGTNFDKLLELGLLEHPVALAALVLGEVLAGCLVLGVAAYMIYTAVVLPARQLQHTQYLITNRRVLIQRAQEELHLDRKQIVDVIESPTMNGFRDVFLVLDGPRARALELSGAFGESERGTHLKPILESLMDSESVSKILLESRPSGPPPPLDSPDEPTDGPASAPTEQRPAA